MQLITATASTTGNLVSDEQIDKDLKAIQKGPPQTKQSAFDQLYKDIGGKENLSTFRLQNKNDLAAEAQSLGYLQLSQTLGKSSDAEIYKDLQNLNFSDSGFGSISTQHSFSRLYETIGEDQSLDAFRMDNGKSLIEEAHRLGYSKAEQVLTEDVQMFKDLSNLEEAHTAEDQKSALNQLAIDLGKTRNPSPLEFRFGNGHSLIDEAQRFGYSNAGKILSDDLRIDNDLKDLDGTVWRGPKQEYNRLCEDIGGAKNLAAFRLHNGLSLVEEGRRLGYDHAAAFIYDCIHGIEPHLF